MQSANCVVLEAARADRSWFAACLVLGTTRADVNRLARRTLEARKVSFASIEKRLRKPIWNMVRLRQSGSPKDWPIRHRVCDFYPLSEDGGKSARDVALVSSIRTGE